MNNINTLPQIIGIRVRKLRKTKGFSQEEFAEIVGVDRSYMGCIERGEYNISSIKLFLIAKALHVEVGELFPNIKSIKI